MKQPIIAAMRTLTSAYILSVLLWHGSSASEHTTTDDQPEALVYNPEATAKLQEVFNATNDRNYTENSPVLGRLVKDEHADPNIKQYGSSDSLLRDATLRDNAPLVEVLLTHRANPNPLDIYNPIFTAKSAAVVKLLVDAKADIHALSRIRQNVLHEAAMYGAPADVITFWCNAGVNLHLKDFCETTPLQTLLTGNNTTGDRMAPFLWAEKKLYEQRRRRCY
jgi:ankyrin repeat protein